MAAAPEAGSRAADALYRADRQPPAIRYHAENPPALAVRMQEMFGEATTPVIAEGGCRWCWSCCRLPSVRCRSPAI